MTMTPQVSDAPSLQRATLAGGCFWCLDAAFRELNGVHEVVSGYMGGAQAHPTYEDVCRGHSGHAEVVQIDFDPAVISFPELLEIFFVLHDPTTLNRQGNDVGTQYRSAIFWHDELQHQEAMQCIAQLTREGLFPAPIVTELAPAGIFWPAEDYHQDYYRHHPGQSYCMFVVGPKVAKVRTKFANRLKPTTPSA